MKNKLWLCFFVSSMVTLCGFQLTDWEYYLAKDKQFSLEVPGEFSSALDTISSAIGPIFCDNLVYQEEIDTLAAIYSLSHCTYPGGTLHSDSTALVSLYFDSTVRNMVESIGGTLLYESDQKFVGYPGKIWKISYDEGKKWGKFKTLMVKNRLYILQVRATNTVETRENATRYLDSFTLRTF